MDQKEIIHLGQEFIENGATYGEQKIKSCIQDLYEIIRFHNQKYYEHSAPIISDQQFDALFHLLKEWEERFPKLKSPDSPTSRIALEVQSELTKTTHLTSMLSLDNAFSREDMEKWEDRILKSLDTGEIPTYTVELKFDGLGISAVYEKGTLLRVVTRGNGEIGEDVSENAKTISSLPRQFDMAGQKATRIEMRGEVVMKKSDFERINTERAESEEALFANPRNAASGSMRQLDPNITAQRKLTAFFYQISLWEPETTEPRTQTAVDALLRKADFLTSPFFAHCENIAAVMTAIHNIAKQKESFDFEIDGAVIKVNECQLREKIGSTGHHPRWAIAYKFPAKQEHTRLQQVEWQVGRTGVLTPVAHLEPISIGGVLVSRATLHNADEIGKKDFRIGDTVVVERAGDVIPKVVIPLVESRTGTEQKIEIPTHCPVCESTVAHLSGEVAIRCENISCPAQIKGRLIHFASKNGLDIENLGKETIDLFVEQGFVQNFADLFRLHGEKILALEGFQKRSVDNLFTALEAAKKKPFWRFITALGIPLVGKRTAKDLAEHYPVFRDLLAASKEELEAIDGIGPEVSESIIQFLHTAENKRMFDALEKAGFALSAVQKSEKSAASDILQGKSFLFTGTLQTMNRPEAQELVEKNGGKAVSSLSKNTDYLVCGENAGSKLEKAQKLGIQIVSEKEFLEMLHRDTPKDDSSDIPSLF